MFVLVYVCVKGRRLPNKGEAAGIVLAACGVVCIATQGDLANLHSQAEGIFWGVVSGLAMALYNILPIEPLERYGTPDRERYGAADRRGSLQRVHAPLDLRGQLAA